MFLSARLQRIEVFHHPQFIISWKDSGSQEKSWCVKAKVGSCCWMCMTIEQSGGVEKPSCNHDGHSHMGSGILRKIHCHSTSPPLHQEIQLEIVFFVLYSTKRKTFINFAQKYRRVVWSQSHLRWTKRQWKHVLWSDQPTFELVFGKNKQILRAKDENDHPDC